MIFSMIRVSLTFLSRNIEAEKSKENSDCCKIFAPSRRFYINFPLQIKSMTKFGIECHLTPQKI